MRFGGFIGPSYKLRSVNVDCQRCINLYPEMTESGRGKEQEVAALVSTPGLLELVDLGDGAIRGEWAASNGEFFVVRANKLYRVSSSFVETELGTLNSSTGPVSMADNGLHVVVVDGEDGYVWTIGSSSFAEITDPDFPGAAQVTYQDGYFVFVKPNSGQFFISGLNDTTFDALDIATSEGSPDDIVATLSNQRDLWMFNEKTIEIFFNSGNADFPFERIQGAYIEKGCAAAYSVAKIDNTVFWLGRDEVGTGVVYSAKGYQPQKISTHAVDQAIQGYSDISDARAYAYQQDGHSFYVLNFPSANTTWVYDAATGLWHERVFTNQGVFERHRADCHAFAHGKHVVGDYENGKLYELSLSTYTDNGSAITRQRIAPHVTKGLGRIFHNGLQLDMETGVGLDGTGQGTDPKVMMQFSDDSGHSWSNEKWASIGRIGQRKARAIWRRLGVSRDRVYKITITDPVKVTLIGAELDALQGAS